MTVNWVFTGGRLQAHNEAGAVLVEWVADDEMGLPLADLLNHAPGLGRLLLAGAGSLQPAPECWENPFG